MTQKQLVLNLDSLKASFDNNLNTVVQTMHSSNKNFDAKIKVLNQHVAGVKSEIVALKTLLEGEMKQKTLERALGLTDLNSFSYYTYSAGHYNYGGQEQKSSEFAKEVLRWFSLGYGAFLPEASLSNEGNYSSKSESEKKAFQKAFREKLTKQIKDLIKREPRLVENSDGRYSIFYD